MSTNSRRKVFLIEGRVQGVGFRWWTYRQAQELGLRGTVCNLPDGRVRVEAEGAESAIHELHRRLNQGPPSARVSAVHDEPAPPGPPFPDFQIRYS